MTIIFDFDGTIADTFPFILQYLAAESGRQPLAPEEQEQFRGLSMLGIAGHMGISRWRLPGLFLRGRRAMGRLQHQVEPFNGMPELITGLHKQGFNLMVLSSNRPRNIQRFLKHHRLDGCFSHVYGQVGLFGKAPALRRIARAHHLEIQDCIYIGDEMRDMEAALSINMPCIAVTWGFANPAHIAALKPTAVAHTPQELTLALQKLITARR